MNSENIMPPLTSEVYLAQIESESRWARLSFMAKHANQVIELAILLAECFKSGGKVMIMGNGGSYYDAQHMASELMGRLMRERGPLPALVLSPDTAISNDYGYEQVFSRQVLALGKEFDILLGISTSGKSKNILQAMSVAKEMSLIRIGLTGGQGGELKDLCDICISVEEGSNASRIQECHIFIIHAAVDIMERFYL